MSVLIINSGPVAECVEIVKHDDAKKRDHVQVQAGGTVTLQPGWNVARTGQRNTNLHISGDPTPPTIVAVAASVVAKSAPVEVSMPAVESPTVTATISK